MQQGYFATAWADIKNSEGWFGKLCLLGLVGLIPIFGIIVIEGYAFGWARDKAWGVHRPLPARIFGNEDGKLYRRGFFVLVIAFVFTLVPAVVEGIFDGVLGVRGAAAGADSMALFMAAGLAGGVLSLVVLALEVAASVFSWVGAVRMSIYDRLGTGFQLGKIWSMLKKDPAGIARIFLMLLMVGIVFGIVFGFVFGAIFGTMAVGAIATVVPHLGSGVFGGGYYGGVDVALQVLRAMGPMVGFAVALALVGVYVCSVFNAFTELLKARALGYWTQQFNVPAWRGQNDPMPHEQAAAAAQAAANAQVTAQPQATYAAPVQAAPVAEQPVAQPQVVAEAQSQVAAQEATWIQPQAAAQDAEAARPQVVEPAQEAAGVPAGAPGPAVGRPDAERASQAPTPEAVQRAIEAKRAQAEAEALAAFQEAGLLGADGEPAEGVLAPADEPAEPAEAARDTAVVADDVAADAAPAPAADLADAAPADTAVAPAPAADADFDDPAN